MKKIIVDKEVYLEYYKMGLSDVKIAKLMNISNSILSRFRNSLNLTVNYVKIKRRNYKKIEETEELTQLLIGTILGDGHLELRKKSKAKNARLKFGHSIKQLEYLKEKIRLSKVLWNSTINKTNIKAEISSISHPLLTKYYRLFYKNGKKILPNIKLNPLGLAILFMDDGSRDKTTNSLYISLCNFTEEENKKFIILLKVTFNLDCSIHYKGKIGQKYPNIYIKAKSREHFKNIIRPYLISSMLYKIGE